MASSIHGWKASSKALVAARCSCSSVTTEGEHHVRPSRNQFQVAKSPRRSRTTWRR
jgi:hypothetical protein